MKVLDLLNAPERWMKHAMAKDAKGNLCSVSDPSAACFCLRGAIDRAYREQGGIVEVVDKLRVAIAARDTQLYGKAEHKLMGWEPKPEDVSVIGYNDRPSTTFEDIRAILEAADV